MIIVTLLNVILYILPYRSEVESVFTDYFSDMPQFQKHNLSIF